MNVNTSSEKIIKLTQFSHGAGCGCKISPSVLDQILGKSGAAKSFPALIVGNDTRDDAAVIDLGDGTGMISTTDFFMPIVDDAFDFGRIAAANAISDVYAMGGTPLMAIAILGWPINDLPPELAGQVIAGGRQVCETAGIPLAGGHSIDAPEPIFGLAVSGRVDLKNLKQNGNAKPGAKLYLTKGLGVGVLATAQKKGLLKMEHEDIGKNSMILLNSIGADAGQLEYVQAMTDVTGFGLLGHLCEMCASSNCSASIDFDKVPLLHESAIHDYIEAGAIPGGTVRNWKSYGHKVDLQNDLQQTILADPQTSGGLLIAVDANRADDFEQVMKNKNTRAWAIGELTEATDKLIKVRS